MTATTNTTTTSYVTPDEQQPNSGLQRLTAYVQRFLFKTGFLVISTDHAEQVVAGLQGLARETSDEIAFYQTLEGMEEAIDQAQANLGRLTALIMQVEATGGTFLPPEFRGAIEQDVLEPGVSGQGQRLLVHGL